MSNKLYEEVKQKKPLSLEQEAFANLQRTSAILMQEVMQALTPSKLSATQYNVLRILRGAGDEGLRCGEISRRLVAHVPDVTRLLDRLDKRGWVERIHDSKDRRAINIRITEAGLEEMESLDEPVKSIQQNQFAKLSKEQLETFIEILELLRHRSE